MSARILLLNPWIYDFAAFDLWAKPMGLLYLGAMLRDAGCHVRLLDCMDRLSPEAADPGGRPGRFPGTGHWRREVICTPEALKQTPRRFARYGLPVPSFLKALSEEPRPDLVLVTCAMTYWYPGLQKAVRFVRSIWPGVKIFLGGTYATLCPGHARKHSGADFVFSGPAEPGCFQSASGQNRIDELSILFSIKKRWSEVWPALDLYPRLDFAPLMTSRGCPLHCPYCASGRLFPAFEQRPAEDVLAEIEDRRQRFGVTDFTFFDDALLINPQTHLMPILEGVLRRGIKVRFHAPNGLHVGLISLELARLMFDSGFKTLRLGLETTDWEMQKAWGGKVEAGEFETAFLNLIKAGFHPGQIGAYLLYGLPGQTLDQALKTIVAVKAKGIRPYPAEFSPLPGTPMWDQAKEQSPFDLEAEPLYHNNTFFPCRGPDFSWEKIQKLKRIATEKAS